MQNKNIKFKQTETRLHQDYGGQVGEIPVDWEIGLFSDYVEINLPRLLKKESLAKSVSMEAIEPFNKKIQSFEVKEYSGGSKFINDDTLMARITPCLENGKTAFVDILDDNEVGFGSTEFIVLSAKENKTDSNFVYYLSRSPQVRNIAIQSMVGSSGRQRVQTDKLAETTLAFPKLTEQQQIADILSSLDDKIELNRKMNKTLEEIGKALFKRWFVDFEFPNDNDKPYKSSGGKMVDSELGEVPEGWEVDCLPKVAKIQKGLSYSGKDLVSEGDCALVGLKCFERSGGFRIDGIKYFIGEFKNDHMLETGDLIVAMTDLTQAADVIGNPAIVPYIPNVNKAVASLDVSILRPTLYLSKEYLYLLLARQESKDFFYSYTNGSTVLHLSIKGLYEFRLFIPPKEILDKFNVLVKNIFSQISRNQQETTTLTIIRDSLLPRLMSGKLRVN